MQKEKLKMPNIISKKELKMQVKALKKLQDTKDLPFNKQIKTLLKDLIKLNKLPQMLMITLSKI
jgi:beta-lactamase class D